MGVFEEIWGRLSASPWMVLLVALLSLAIWGLDLASASYVWFLFKKFGGPGALDQALAATEVFGGALFLRIAASSTRRCITRWLAMTGPDGDLAVMEAVARLSDKEERSKAVARAEAVAGAFSGDALLYILDLPVVPLFAVAIFFNGGEAAGTACFLLMVVVALSMMLASARTRKLGLRALDAKMALLIADGPDEAAAKARETCQRRMRSEGAMGTEREVGVVASWGALAASVGVACMVGPLAAQADLMACSIVAGRGIGVLIAGLGALSRMTSALPAIRGLAATLK